MDKPRFDIGHGRTEQLLLELLDLRQRGENEGADEILAAISVLVTPNLDYGKTISQFEEAFSAKVGARHAVAVGSCTQGLELILETIGLNETDEVITTPYTWFGTVNPIIK